MAKTKGMMKKKATAKGARGGSARRHTKGSKASCAAVTQKRTTAQLSDDEDSIDEEDGVFDAQDERQYGETIDTIFERQGPQKKRKTKTRGQRKASTGRDDDSDSDSDRAFDDDDVFASAAAGGGDLMSLMNAMQAKAKGAATTSTSAEAKNKKGRVAKKSSLPQFAPDAGASDEEGSFSDDDGSAEHETAAQLEHDELLQDVAAQLGTSPDENDGHGKATGGPRRNRLAHVSESMAHLLGGEDVDEADAVNLQELLQPLAQKQALGNVQRQLLKLEESAQKLEHEEVLGDVKQARKDRAVNYEASKRDARKWDQQVRANRNSSQLLFGDYEDLLENRSTKSLAASFQFKTAANSIAKQGSEQTDSFEADLALALAETKELEMAARDEQRLDGTGTGGLLADGDGQTTGANPAIREAKRTQQMAHLRALQLRELTRAKRLKKIKSKSFHRVKKRMDNKEREKVLSRLEQEDPELAAQIKREMEQKLAEVRSRRGADARKKWARAAQRFGGKEMRSVISTQAQKAEDDKRALQRALKAKEQNNDSDDEDLDLSDEDLDPLEKAEQLAKRELEESFKLHETPGDDTMKKGLFGLKFMQDAMAKKREESQKQAAALLGELGRWREEAAPTKKDQDEEVDQRSDHDDTSSCDEEGEDEAFSHKELAEAEKALGAPGSGEEGAVILSSTSPPCTTGATRTSSGSSTGRTTSSCNTLFIAPGASTTGANRRSGEATGVVTVKREKAGSVVPPAHDQKGRTAQELQQTHPEGGENSSGQPPARGTSERSAPAKFTSEPHEDRGSEGDNSSDSEDSEGDLQQVKNPFAQVDRADADNAQLIRSAFATFGEDNQTDFDRDINQQREDRQSRAEEQANKMSGWGSWAGVGLETTSAAKRRKVVTTLNPATACNTRVTVLNQGQPSKAFSDKYEVQNLPHPFQSKEQYETALGKALGSEWNTGSVHKYKIQPQVVTRLGAVVQPLRYIKHAPAEDRDEMLQAWSKNHKPKKPKARF
ncbi:unnamed protein product [Amoebophrya sp. A120]|nr:unnamed protein product [Amoebophrya sp. A120]|eukprot:GSA120T00016800001.1